MIPYFEQPSFSLGPLTIYAFGLIVAVSGVVGYRLALGRFRTLSLDASIGEGLAWHAIVGGFLGAHLFSVLFYFPEKILENPLILLKLWEDVSSFGGILGGFLGMWIYFQRKTPHLARRTRVLYLDAVALAFPPALAIGRVACSLAHDHPGSVTSFPLAVSLESQPAREFIQAIYGSAGRLAELPPEAALAAFGVP